MSSVEEYIVAKPAIVSADTDVYEVVHLILSNLVSGFRFQVLGFGSRNNL